MAMSSALPPVEMACVLKLVLSCRECWTRVNYVLHNLQGVSTFEVNTEKNLACIKGTVDPRFIVEALTSSDGIGAQVLRVQIIGNFTPPEYQSLPPPQPPPKLLAPALPARRPKPPKKQNASNCCSIL